MFNLVKNEIFKIFHKKSTYIILVILLLYTILINVIYKTDIPNSNYYYKMSEVEREEALNFIDNFDEKKDSYYDLIDAKQSIETDDLKRKYQNDDWQMAVIDNGYHSIMNEYYNNYYFEEPSTLIKEKYEAAKKALENDDWLYFARIEKSSYEDELKRSKAYLEEMNKESEEYKNALINVKALEENIKWATYRIDEKVEFNSGYLDDALNTITSLSYDVFRYNESKNDKEKTQFEESVKEYYKTKYILDTKEDTNNTVSLRAVITNLFSECFFIILVFTIMIFGSIVSDEFNKGTIKSLLITPHRREKILGAKFISALIMIPFIIVVCYLMELIVGGIMFGFSSLKIPIISYDLIAKTIVSENLFKYTILQCISKLPIIILLATLAFAISTIFNNTALAITLSLCGFIGSEIINSLALVYKIKILNYFVTTNWDFSVFLNGGKSPFNLSITHSLIVCLVYFLIMVVVSFVVFKRRDIKNI